ncbi:MAG: class C sortase [Eubacterium sp.]|nr:class C sortase [Eubacterium sp.]
MQLNNNVEKKKKKTGRFRLFLIIILLLGGVAVLFYPTFSDLWNRYRTSQLMTSYAESVGKSDEESKKELEAAQAYNQSHTVNQIVDAFSENQETSDSQEYEALLNPTGDGMMGWLEIPKIGQKLAIYHGTDAETLEKGVGHLEGTSLPVGGEGTHAVLSAHRGLPSAKMFTDLDQLKEGDRFYLTVLDQKMAYEVDQILVVDPSETSALAIEPGKDLVTLVTCTPYGINTERLLVRGHRIPYSEKEKTKDESSRSLLPSNRAEWLFLFAVAALVLFTVILIVKRKKR